jgi:hypothetical protein
MKKQFNLSNAVRKTILSVGFTSFFLASFIPSVVNAQDKTPSSPVVIKYIGNIDNYPVFQIEFDNKNEETFNISIKDDEGTVIYGEKFRDKKFSKKFKYEGAGAESMKLTFILMGEKEKQSQQFEVNTNTRVVQDVVVTRL